MDSCCSTSYQQRDWKIEPKSIFDIDPLQDGVESRSLSHLHTNVPKTVYEGYGKKDFLQRCVPRVKGLEPKPAISWVHGGITRPSNSARLAEASAKFVRSGVKVNGIDINVLLAAKEVEDHYEDSVSDDEARQAVIRENATPDFVFLPPALPPPKLTPIYTPEPYKPVMAPIKQPLYKNFNRCAKPFSR